MEGKPLENFEQESKDPNLIFQKDRFSGCRETSPQLITLETMRPDWMLLW